jgi:hypothetical protein
MFHRVNMHEMLMDSAVGVGDGIPATLVLDHACREIDLETGLITFENGKTAKHDLIVGSDGIGVSLAILSCDQQVILTGFAVLGPKDYRSYRRKNSINFGLSALHHHQREN